MPDYHLCGGVLRSSLSLPDLTPADGAAPSWFLQRVDSATQVDDSIVLGCEEVDKGVTVTLSQIPNGLRLTFDDTGTFDILEGGQRIDWAAPPDPDLEAVRKDVLGRVIAVALSQQRITTLHGSAVAIGDLAVAFIAPKFHGKSTTATALVNAGGRLLADDLVPVTDEATPMVLPSVPVVQLWKDSAERLSAERLPVGSAPQSPKVQVAWSRAERNASGPVPLSAVYLLVPVQPAQADSVRRLRLNGVQAALALLGQAKVGALLGTERRAALLQVLVELSMKVPVYRLEIPRDFDRIGELTSSLLGWHSPLSSADASSGGSK